MPVVGGLVPVGSHAVMSSSLATSYVGTLLANADSGSGGSILSFLFLPLILLAMYFLTIRPQRKRMRQQQELQQSIEVGDFVVTTSGVFGTITGEDGPNRFWLEIDDENEVQIRIARAAIQNVADIDDEHDHVGQTAAGDEADELQDATGDAAGDEASSE